MALLIVCRYKPGPRMRKHIESTIPEGQDITYYGIDPRHRVAEGQTVSKSMLKELRGDFEEHMDSEDSPEAILALGNEALFVTSGHSGIMKWRGKEMAFRDIPLMATISPGAVERNPSQGELLAADIRGVLAMMSGDRPEGLPPTVRVVASRERLKMMLDRMREADAIAFDLETSGFDELADGAFIVSMAITISSHDGERVDCWAIPLCHRQSPWNGHWVAVLRKIAEVARQVPVRIAHNAKFDCRWMVQFDAPIPVNFDTMLAAHLLDENRKKSLKHLARVLLDAPEWDIQIKGGKNALPWYEQHKIKDILIYNGLDTWYTLALYNLFRPPLNSDARLSALFKYMMMPASQSLVHIERRGVYVDRERLDAATVEVRETLGRIEDELASFLPPEDDLPHAVNWNPSGFLRWFLYEHLELPVIERGKVGPSTREEVMKTHAADSPEGSHQQRVAQLLVDRIKWQKFNSGFIEPYRELITPESRLHSTFKLAGTVTGRLASGKADSDKVTGARNIRGVNLQQVPRDPLIRGIFGAPPGWTFVEADYSQIELRIAAELADERTMLGLYARGEDIHMTMAMRMTGKPASEVTAEERKKAKAVNFGFLYGMGWRKFVSTAWSNYGVRVTEAEAQAFRKAFFTQFPGLVLWHGRQRRLSHKFKRVQSPLGRIRHLPDIDSQDEGVVAEAERQSINSPVQATASDLCLLSMTILDRKFRKAGLQARPIGLVHDAINFEVPDDELCVVLPMIKHHMENAPTQKLFGYSLRVPIVADVAVGKHWGTKTEVPAGTVTNPAELSAWIERNNK